MSSDEVVNSTAPTVIVSGIPPLDVASPTFEPLQGDFLTDQTLQPSSKRRRRDSRFENLESSLSQGFPFTPTTTPAIVTPEPLCKSPSSLFEAGVPQFHHDSLLQELILMQLLCVWPIILLKNRLLVLLLRAKE